ncbi:DUF599 domain-containing protein [Pseudoruegeria sp. HB172150]|uniref:DUF599 domain-containing protein n=1 Tax=Pseudoruegeria sp. HB172150 TaxID=2721164 RepID=UPI0015569A89|nr:DUF599 domain-containing protein [Pseudoruegeria sp. HB172150]
MDLISRLQFFSPLDAVAVVAILIAWFAVAYVIEHPAAHRVSTAVLMEKYRVSWMEHYITRSPRVFDSMVMGNLRQGASFFASTCLIAVGGGLALVGNTDQLLGLAEDLSLENAPAVIWDVKIVFMLLFLANGLFKFIWSYRLFGYCLIVMGAAPNDEGEMAYHRAHQAAGIANSAARSFNRGLRAVYFALGAAAWLLGPVALLVATAIVISILLRREFASKSRLVLLNKAPE